MLHSRDTSKKVYTCTLGRHKKTVVFSPTSVYPPALSFTKHPHSKDLLPLELVLSHGKSALQKILLLLGVRRLETGGHRRAGVAAGVHHVLAVMVLRAVEQSLDARLSVAPGTSVERLLLRPDDGLGVRVLVEVLAELLPGEGVELLDAGDGNVVDLVVGAVLVKTGIDLARAEDDAVNLLGSLDLARLVGWVGDDPLELGLANELLNVGAGERMTEESLGEEEDEG